MHRPRPQKDPSPPSPPFPLISELPAPQGSLTAVLLRTPEEWPKVVIRVLVVTRLRMRVHWAARSWWRPALASAVGLAFGRRTGGGCCRTQRFAARSSERACARAVKWSNSTRTRRESRNRFGNVGEWG
eukprot:3489039-Pleurochrysis_carterae.AAC.1